MPSNAPAAIDRFFSFFSHTFCHQTCFVGKNKKIYFPHKTGPRARCPCRALRAWRTPFGGGGCSHERCTMLPAGPLFGCVFVADGAPGGGQKIARTLPWRMSEIFLAPTDVSVARRCASCAHPRAFVPHVLGRVQAGRAGDVSAGVPGGRPGRAPRSVLGASRGAHGALVQCSRSRLAGSRPVWGGARRQPPLGGRGRARGRQCPARVFARSHCSRRGRGVA